MWHNNYSYCQACKLQDPILFYALYKHTRKVSDSNDWKMLSGRSACSNTLTDEHTLSDIVHRRPILFTSYMISVDFSWRLRYNKRKISGNSTDNFVPLRPTVPFKIFLFHRFDHCSIDGHIRPIYYCLDRFFSATSFFLLFLDFPYFSFLCHALSSGAVLGIFIWVGQSKAEQILGRTTGVVYVWIMEITLAVWVGQARVWVGHGLPGLTARTASG